MTEVRKTVIPQVFKTTFTPDGSPEEPKKCAGDCGKILPATRFKFKYDTRKGVRGKVRNSTCTGCTISDRKFKDSVFQCDTKDRLKDYEGRIEDLENTVNSLTETVESIQLMIIKLSGDVERLKSIESTAIGSKPGVSRLKSLKF